MMRISTWLAICLISGLAAGCAPLPPQDTPGNVAVLERSQPPKGVAPAPAGAQPLAVSPQVYARQFVELAPVEQKKEYLRLMQSLNNDKKDGLAKLKAGLILSHPDSRHRDLKRAASLLAAAAQSTALAKEDAALAAIQLAQLEERQKLEDAAQNLGLKLRQEQTRTDELQQRAEHLQQKLEELKNIEKTMLERNRGGTP